MKHIRIFLSENFHFLVVKFSIYLNRNIFVINQGLCCFIRTFCILGYQNNTRIEYFDQTTQMQVHISAGTFSTMWLNQLNSEPRNTKQNANPSAIIMISPVFVGIFIVKRTRKAW